MAKAPRAADNDREPTTGGSPMCPQSSEVQRTDEELRQKRQLLAEEHRNLREAESNVADAMTKVRVARVRRFVWNLQN